MNDQKKLLETLVRLEIPAELPATLNALRQFDDDRILVMMTGNDVAVILQRYLAGELTRAQVWEWAEGLELRDDIGFGTSNEEDEHDEFTLNLVYELANPTLEGDLTPERAKQLIAEIISRESGNKS